MPVPEYCRPCRRLKISNTCWWGTTGSAWLLAHAPVTLPIQGPTFADINALVCWTVGQRVSVSSHVGISRQIYATESGETFNMQFQAMGGGHFIVVQPFEV